MSKTATRPNVLSFATWRAPRSLLGGCITETLSQINTSKSLMAEILLRYEQFDDVVKLEIDPLHYLSASDFHRDLSVVSLLSKSKFLRTSFDKTAIAKQKYLLSEELCRMTNERVSHPDLSDENIRRFVTLLSVASRKIDQVLGDVPYDKVLDYAGWGPGTTTQVKGEWCSHTNKFQSETGCTRDALPVIKKILPRCYPSWVMMRWGPEIGSKVSFVPKNAKTDRTIAIEPGLNLWFQRGIGRSIRSRLKRVGVDLSDQSINQELARQGSLSGELATIDFSMASDTVSTELVRQLLPKPWYELLNTFRCKWSEVDGKWLRLEKFSSMGNGFTFELESLIFYALAWACCHEGDTISVYGDDVILPSTSTQLFRELSAFCGFEVNVQKSYSSGPYRESCGSHWFLGEPCKPFFLKEKLSDLPSLHRFYNGISALDFPELKSVQELLDRSVPRWLRLYGPSHLGDGVMHNTADLSAKNVRWDRHLQCFSVRSLRFTSKVRPDESHALLLARLYGLGSAISASRDTPSTLAGSLDSATAGNSYGNLITSRGKYRLITSWIPTSQWDQHEHLVI